MLLGEETDYRRGHVTDAGLSCHPFSFFLSILVLPSPGIFSRTTDVFVRKSLERNDFIEWSPHAFDGRREREIDTSPVIRVTLFCIILIQKYRMDLACREDNSCFAPL